MTVFLCGFMGCGKTTAGKLAAKKLGYAYADTDEMIVKQENRSIPEIFAESGEPYFRSVEAEVVKSLCGKNAVVSCGGGALLNDSTAEAAKKDGIVIFLDVPFEVCYERIKNDSNRPIAASSDKEELLERFNKRHGIYLKNSDVRIDCCGTPLENAEKIADAVKRGKNADI